MSQWSMVKLGDICKPVSNRGDKADLEVYSVTKHNGFVLSSEYFKKQVFSKNTKNYKICEKDDFAYATIHLDEGSIGFSPERCLISPMYTVFRPDYKKVDKTYLLYLLKSERSIAQYSILGSGSVERRKSIKFNDLAKLQFPLPPLEEQRRIVRILNTPSHVKALIAKRIQLLDVLISSIIKNYYSSAYPTVKVGEIARVATGATPSRKNKEFFNGNIPWVKTGEVLNNRLSETEEHISAQALKETSCNLLPTGSTLVAMYGQGKTRGRVAILEKPMTTNQACAAVTPFNESDSEYLFQILRFNYHELRSAGRGGTQPNLNLGIVKNFQIPYPQNSVERAQLIRQCLEIDSQKSKLESQLQKFEELHQSLATRAFAGQL